MTRGRLLFLLLSLALVLPLIAGAVVAREGAAGDEDSLFKYLSVFTDVLGLVQQAYVDETEVGILMDGAMEGFTDALDPFAIYVPASSLEHFRAALDGETRPAGLLLVRERGLVYVAGVDRGSPGAEAGLSRGDLISRIDGSSTRDLPIWEVWRRLAPRQGTETVALEVVRLGETRQVDLAPRTFAPQLTVVSHHEEELVLEIGVFNGETRQAVAKVLGSEDSAPERLILDLRGVSGGQAEAAYQVAELFVAGDLGSLKGQDGVRRRFSAGEGAKWSGRLVTMVDGGTLGPAEILAAVLHQAGATVLVGERTFGHAGEAEIIQVSSGAAIYLTTAFYAGQDDVPLSHGVVPDEQLNLAPRNFAERDTTVDERILQRAIELVRGDEVRELDLAA